MSVAVSPASPAVGRGRLLVLVIVLAGGAVLPLAAARALDAPAIDHLVISEIVTGGVSALDELVELYNPSPSARALDGLELVYVSASGATMSGRAAWSAGAPVVPPGGHVLVANEAGIYAALADAVYSAGIAAGGGSVALRVQGGGGAIDAIGWGTAAGNWREGSNAPAPAAGGSIERLPGGASGSTQDTDDNAADFVERPLPDPQHLGSAPTPDGGPAASAPDASASVAPTSPGVTPSPGATQLPTTSPSPASASAVPVADARAAPNGTLVTVEATALTRSDFHDGGGFLADASGGIAVLVEAGSFSRGSLLRVTGTVDDRFAQRTIRARGSDVASLGAGGGAAVAVVSTGSVDESTEGRLVRVVGIVRGSPATLAAGTAYDLDDGTGTVRVIVPAASGIDSSAWAAGARVELVGVAGQRDATGSGSSGYRVMPRDVDDVIGVEAVPASPSPTAPQVPSATSTAPAQAGADVVPIRAARSAPKNERVRVRGVVTMPTGILDPLTAVVQDDTAAIVLRLGSDAGDLVRGERIEAGGTRSTLSGMETLRVDGAPLRLGTAAEPVPRAIRTGDAGEALEAALVSARGALVAAPRRASSGTVTFEVDDGSGALRVSLDASIGFKSETLGVGTVVEVRGVLGQETSGAQPLLGYRIWPRSADDVRVIAIGEMPAQTTGARDKSAGAGTSAVATGSLGEVGRMDLAGLRVAATLVVGPWAELGIGGLLWDGERLVAVHAASSVLVAALGEQAPIALELAGLRTAGTEPSTGVPLVLLGSEPDSVQAAERPPAHPSTALGDATDRAVWISLVGRLADGGRSLAVDGESLPLEHRCDEAPPPGSGIVGVTAVALGDPARLIAPCGGIRAAPAVGRPGAGRASLPPRVAAVPAAAVGTPVAAEDGRRGVVAGMFVLSAAMLGGAAVARRRSVSRDGIEGAEPGADAGEGPGAPHLGLMSVRRERGP